ncbi:MAG: hypothetical protein U1G07_24015 [Verrucomicrobiota bacterium]
MRKHIAVAFGAALALYCIAFYVLEHLRTRKGGWEIRFQTDTGQRPALVVAQPQLGLSNITIVFPGQQSPATNQLIVFDRPRTNVPFGKVVYFDTTFLPGSVVLSLFGHEIQLLPRVLLIDNRETAWQSGATYQLP